MWTLSGFADEIDPDLETQCRVLDELGIRYIEFRSAWGVNVLCLAILIFTRDNNRRFAVFTHWRFNRQIFIRLMRIGIPGSCQFTMDILAFTFFILLVGRIGRV